MIKNVCRISWSFKNRYRFWLCTSECVYLCMYTVSQNMDPCYKRCTNTGQYQWSCDIETKMLALKNTWIQFLKVLVLVSRTGVKVLVLVSRPRPDWVARWCEIYISHIAVLKSLLCTGWHRAVFSSPLHSWLQRGCLLIVIRQRLMLINLYPCELMSAVISEER